jgi:hypothetical protein
MTQPTIIVDIDGTIADCSHRAHWVRSNPKNWPAFNKGMKNDTKHDDIIWLVKTLYEAGCTILIASGRGDEDRPTTIEWLDTVAGLGGIYQKLYMRKAKDYRSDDIVKSEILDQMRQDGYNPSITIDDRNQVVSMWRERGLRCLQVAPGDF